MWLYIDYPVPTFTIHNNPGCGAIRMHKKPNARIMHIDSVNLDSQIKKFKNQEIRFAAEATFNCLWIEIHLQSWEQEEALVHQIQTILGKRYRPLVTAPVKHHC